MVEFAFVLPVLFVLTVGLIDVGRAFYHYNTAAHAAREAARFASVWGGSQHHDTFDWSASGNRPGTYTAAGSYAGTIVGTVQNYAAGFNLNDLAVTISAPDPGGLSPRNTIGVTVVYTFRPASLLVLGGQSFPVVASSQMVIE